MSSIKGSKMQQNYENNSSSNDDSDDSDDNTILSYDKINTNSKNGNERCEVKQDHSSMSMKDLLQLQEKVGTKQFAKLLCNTSGIEEPNSKVSSSKKRPVTTSTSKELGLESFKRANKNRPREVPMQRRTVRHFVGLDPKLQTKKKIKRDPRFDDLSGDLNMEIWQKNYKFIRETRKQEKLILKKQLKTETDPTQKQKLKLTVQRMENQEREHEKREKVKEIMLANREEQINSMKEGKKPHFLNKTEKKLLVKAAHFEQLKKDNKVDKYLKRQEKKQEHRERKRNNMAMDINM